MIKTTKRTTAASCAAVVRALQ